MPRLSPTTFSIPSSSFFLTAPCFNKHTLKSPWTHVVKSFLHRVRNPPITGWPEADIICAQFLFSDTIILKKGILFFLLYLLYDLAFVPLQGSFLIVAYMLYQKHQN